MHYFDGDRYQLGTYVVMPNHVHLLFLPLGDHHLFDLIHFWKRHTSREINKLEGHSGTLWQADCWDRLIRSKDHFDWVVKYIGQNPANHPPCTYILG